MTRSIAVRNPMRGVFRDDFFDDVFGGAIRAVTVPTYNLDLYETQDMVVVELEAPQFTPENVDITIEDSTLTVSGSLKTESEDAGNDRKYYHKEISQQSFSRAVTLPTRVKAEEAEATFVNGLIKIALPKAEEVKPKKVMVKKTA